MSDASRRWEKKLNGYYLSFLRKVFRWSPAYKEALAKAQVKKEKKLFYRCAETGKLCAREDKAVDHREPVVPTDDSWANHNYDWGWIRDRMGFTRPENLQVLSKEAHKIKTQKENEERRQYKKAKKEAA